MKTDYQVWQESDYRIIPITWIFQPVNLNSFLLISKYSFFSVNEVINS